MSWADSCDSWGQSCDILDRFEGILSLSSDKFSVTSVRRGRAINCFNAGKGHFINFAASNLFTLESIESILWLVIIFPLEVVPSFMKSIVHLEEISVGGSIGRSLELGGVQEIGFGRYNILHEVLHLR